MTRYVVVDPNTGDWVELDSGAMIVEVTDEWYQENVGSEFTFDLDCDNYLGGETEGILAHWHTEDVFQSFLVMTEEAYAEDDEDIDNEEFDAFSDTDTGGDE